MKRHLAILGAIILLLIVSGCGDKNKTTPEDVAGEFISLWKTGKYPEMYALVTDDAKDQYAEQFFTERNEKITEDLEIEKLEITTTPLTDEQLKQVKESGKATLPLEISFHTIAGKIDFSKEMPIILQKEDKEEEWRIDWDEGFILPELEEQSEVVIEHTQPRRGEILDRNQMPLALNDVAYEIGVIPEDFNVSDNQKQRIAQLLNMTTERIDTSLNASWVKPDFFVPLHVIPSDANEKLDELMQIDGVTYQETSGRTYPLGPSAAHLTGYVGKITQEELEELPKGKYTEHDIIGKSGLEQTYENVLRGEEGIQISIVTENETGSEEKEMVAEKPVKNGDNVQLSIDANIQDEIHQTYGDISGSATAINPKNGEVLALVSNPAYDPNELSYGITESRWDAIMEDEQKPFLNRFRSTFAPGSSIKPITAAVGLGNGSINFKDQVEIDGLTWGKKEWGNVEVTRVSTSEKPVDLQDALQRSDNIYFAMKAVDMGNKNFIDGMKSIGFEDKIPFEFPIKKSQISNNGKLDEILLANTSYGQGEIEMSSLHVALAYTMFLNEGNMLKPSLILEGAKKEIWKESIINEKQADTMKEYLRTVVKEGTAKSANDDDLPISGKTGTAELKLAKDTKGHQNGWFVGYPTEDEDILIAMMMEHVENEGSSSYVAGKVKDILKDIKK